MEEWMMHTNGDLCDEDRIILMLWHNLTPMCCFSTSNLPRTIYTCTCVINVCCLHVIHITRWHKYRKLLLYISVLTCSCQLANVSLSAFKAITAEATLKTSWIVTNKPEEACKLDISNTSDIIKYYTCELICGQWSLYSDHSAYALSVNSYSFCTENKIVTTIDI